MENFGLKYIEMTRVRKDVRRFFSKGVRKTEFGMFSLERGGSMKVCMETLRIFAC